MTIRSATLAALGLALFGGAALAAPGLVSSTPAAAAEVEPASPIELHFDEKLVSKSSGAKLSMTSMPGMSDHPPMGMAVTVSGSADGKTILVKPDQPLPRGAYRVDWRVVGKDGKPVGGSLDFRVK